MYKSIISMVLVINHTAIVVFLLILILDNSFFPSIFTYGVITDEPANDSDAYYYDYEDYEDESNETESGG